MDPSTVRGLTFLFSLGTLPVACNPEKSDTTGGDSSGGSTSTDGAGSTSAPTSTEGGTDGASDGGPTEGTGAGATDTGGAGGVCTTYVAFQIQCNPSLAGMEAQLLDECEVERIKTATIYGEACVAPLDAALECVAMTDCAAQDPCAAEWTAVQDCLPAPGPLCQAYAAKVVECIPGTNLEFEGGSCQAYLNDIFYYSGAACGAAYEEYYACINELSCSELEMDIFCDSQAQKIEATCM